MDKQKSGKKKRDALLLIFIIAGAAVLAIIFWAVRKGSNAENVIVKVDGNVVYTDSVNKDNTFTVTGYDGGYNVVEIKDGKVYVKEADCPDKVCVNSGGVSDPGATIVCMPHRVVVEISGTSTASTDAVVN